MDLSDVGTYDRLIVTDLIKDIAQTAQVDAGAKRSFKGKNDKNGANRNMNTNRNFLFIHHFQQW